MSRYANIRASHRLVLSAGLGFFLLPAPPWLMKKHHRLLVSRNRPMTPLNPSTV